jgi:hypothetical protein
MIELGCIQVEELNKQRNSTVNIFYKITWNLEMEITARCFEYIMIVPFNNWLKILILATWNKKAWINRDSWVTDWTVQALLNTLFIIQNETPCL